MTDSYYSPARDSFYASPFPNPIPMVMPDMVAAPTPTHEQLVLFDLPKSDPPLAAADIVQPSVVKSTGGSTTYYDLPDGASDLGDIIEHTAMPFNLANIFKACKRIGQKAGTDIEYDLNKMEYFLKRIRDYYSKTGKLS